MDKFCIDWARHTNVNAWQFDEAASYDHGRPSIPDIKCGNGEVTETHSLFDGCDRTHWEYVPVQQYLRGPGTIGVFIDLNNRQDGRPVETIEIFWGKSHRLDRSPDSFAIDIVPARSNEMFRIYEESNINTKETHTSSSGHEKGGEDDERSVAVNPATYGGDRFARDYPGVTATRVRVTKHPKIRAICIKLFHRITAFHPPAIRRVHAWGQLRADPLGAADLMLSTRVPASFVRDADPRLFMIPTHGVVALNTAIHFSAENLVINPLAAKHVGVLSTIPDHVLRELLCFLTFKDLKGLALVSKTLGVWGETLWSSPAIQMNKTLINWARLPTAYASATSRWNNTDAEDPQNLIDGTNDTWWSSAAGTDACEIRIDLGFVCPVEKIDILWGDDNGRIRPCSKRFDVEVSIDGHFWHRIHRTDTANGIGVGPWLGRDGPAYLPDQDVLQYTTTNITTKAEMFARYITVQLHQRAPRWANHAISQIQVYGYGRENDVCGSIAGIYKNHASTQTKKLHCTCSTS
jgi:hypothetical protein